MERNIKILFAGSTQQHISEFTSTLEYEADISLVGQTCDGYTLIELIEALKPDAVVMDLVLNRLDGLGVLSRLQQLADKPKILVYSAFGNMVELAASMGADAFILKPCSTQNVCNRLRQMVSMGQCTPTASIPASALQLQNQVTAALMDLGVPTHILGFKFLRKAIIYALENPKYLEGITKTLYPSVARYYESTPCRVERAIRHAIEVTWDRSDENTLRQYFGQNTFYKCNKPTNGEFIAVICEHILMVNTHSIGA